MDYIVIPANLHTFGEGIFSGSSGRVFCEYSVAEWKNLSLDWKGLFGGMTIYTKGKWYLEDGKPVLKPRKKKEKVINKTNADIDWDDIELEFDDMEFDDLLLDEDF